MAKRVEKSCMEGMAGIVEGVAVQQAYDHHLKVFCGVAWMSYQAEVVESLANEGMLILRRDAEKEWVHSLDDEGKVRVVAVFCSMDLELEISQCSDSTGKEVEEELADRSVLLVKVKDDRLHLAEKHSEALVTAVQRAMNFECHRHLPFSRCPN